MPLMGMHKAAWDGMKSNAIEAYAPELELTRHN